jgi:hypothetical protein
VGKRGFGEELCSGSVDLYDQGVVHGGLKHVSRATRARPRLRGKTVVPSMVSRVGFFALKGRESCKP